VGGSSVVISHCGSVISERKVDRAWAKYDSDFRGASCV